MPTLNPAPYASGPRLKQGRWRLFEAPVIYEDQHVLYSVSIVPSATARGVSLPAGKPGQVVQFFLQDETSYILFSWAVSALRYKNWTPGHRLYMTGMVGDVTTIRFVCLEPGEWTPTTTRGSSIIF